MMRLASRLEHIEPFYVMECAKAAAQIARCPECDPSRDDAEAFAARLEAAGVAVVAKRYPGMVHGFGSWVGFLPGARDMLQDAAQFLKLKLAN